MKLGIFADIHFHNYKKFDNEGSRLKDCSRALITICKQSYKKGIRYILFSGDLYNTPKGLPSDVVNEVVSTLQHVFQVHPDLHIIAISGNHDQPRNNFIESSVYNTALVHLHEIYPNFHLIDNSCYNIIGTSINVVGIPYYNYPEDFKKAVLTCYDSHVNYFDECINILLIHQTPTGISNTNIPADTNPKDKIYKKFDMVFCGHIHKHEKLTTKFIVIGSPLHRDLSDVGEKKGYLIYDTETKEVIKKKLKGFPTYSRNRVQKSEDDFNIPDEIDKPEAIVVNQEIIDKFSIGNKRKVLLKNYLKYMKVENGKDLLKVGKEYV